MKYESINEPDSFTYVDYFSDADGSVQDGMPVLTTTIELREEDGKTTVVTHCQAESAEDIEKLLAMGMIEGFTSTVDRLEQFLATV